MNNERTAPDLTPAEARAEVEAFMGEKWRVHHVYAQAVDPLDQPVGVTLYARHACRVEVLGYGESLRAAVDALKQAWRDAVRPWCVSSAAAGLLACNEEMPNCVDIVNGVLGMSRACRKCNGVGRTYPLLGDGFGYGIPCDCERRGDE